MHKAKGEALATDTTVQKTNVCFECDLLVFSWKKAVQGSMDCLSSYLVTQLLAGFCLERDGERLCFDKVDVIRVRNEISRHSVGEER